MRLRARRATANSPARSVSAGWGSAAGTDWSPPWRAIALVEDSIAIPRPADRCNRPWRGSDEIASWSPDSARPPAAAGLLPGLLAVAFQAPGEVARRVESLCASRRSHARGKHPLAVRGASTETAKATPSRVGLWPTGSSPTSWWAGRPTLLGCLSSCLRAFVVNAFALQL